MENKRVKKLNQEKILQYFVLFLLMLNFVAGVGYPTISSLFVKPFSVDSITINTNGTTELKPVPPIPMIPTAMVLPALMERFIFLLPITLLGIFLIPNFLFIFSRAEASYFSAHFLPHAILWILAVTSIFVTFRYSSGLPLWKKLLYSYLIAALIAGMGAVAWSPIFTG